MDWGVHLVLPPSPRRTCLPGKVHSGVPPWRTRGVSREAFVGGPQALDAFKAMESMPPLVRCSDAQRPWGRPRPVGTTHCTRVQRMGIRMTLPATGKLVWQCGDHTVKLESASYVL